MSTTIWPTALWKEVNKPNHVPNGQHYGIITFSTVHHEGDERSRTNPGHGYPAYSESVSVYRIYANREEWELAIKDYTLNRREFVPLIATRAEVSTEVKVKG